MTRPTISYGSSASGAAEEQMRRWALQMEVEQRLHQERPVDEVPRGVKPYVAISRDTGAGGAEVAQRVGAALGWEVLGRELLDEMTDRFQLERPLVDFVDETTVSWLVESFGQWLDRRMVTSSQYLARLGRLMLMAAHHESAVFLGRGAQFMLPRERGIAVQIVAPLEQRIERVARRQACSRPDALAHIERTDEQRAQFVQKYFHQDINDAHLHDATINLGYVGREEAAEMIVTLVHRRFGKPKPK